MTGTNDGGWVDSDYNLISAQTLPIFSAAGY